MIRVNQVKLPIDHKEQDLLNAVAKAMKVKKEEIREILIKKRSIDARKKNELKYIYAVDVKIKNEEKVVARAKNPNVTITTEKNYRVVVTGEKPMEHRPIVVGSGPAGLFCAYQLAFYGYRPILVERGGSVEERVKDVDTFWETNVLNPESNVQFGEGGAGTFSDGKLNTMVKDTFGRIRKVLEIFVEHGANEEILYLNKPHIGTDHLREVVKSMREDIIARGGEVLFHTKLVDVKTVNGAVSEVILEATKDGAVTSTMVMNDEEKSTKIASTTSSGVATLSKGETITLPCTDLILAIGHSARDTFEMLYKNQLPMERKAFAVGVRMEHKQEMISHNQYGEAYAKLPAADYKVTYQAKNGRAVYSFCMCPGGYVVNASSEEGRLVVNGMSYHDRAGDNANSAIIVTVGEKDYLNIPGAKDTPLSGMEFQRYYEALAYQTGRGNVPVQLFQDFKEKKKSVALGHIEPNLKGNYEFANLHECLPEEVGDTIIEGVLAFDRMIPGFADGDAILSGVEMRTSSPVRMNRDEHLESEIKGIYPCGEGAGYAGGITSAAVDGLKVFEVLAAKYCN